MVLTHTYNLYFVDFSKTELYLTDPSNVNAVLRSIGLQGFEPKLAVLNIFYYMFVYLSEQGIKYIYYFNL